MLKLAHQLSIADLYRQQGLARLDALFLERLARTASALHARLVAARAAPEAVAAADESSLILELAPHLEEFLIELFGIADADTFRVMIGLVAIAFLVYQFARWRHWLQVVPKPFNPASVGIRVRSVAASP